MTKHILDRLVPRLLAGVLPCVLLAACSSSSTLDSADSVEETASEDPTPLEPDVDYTQLADFSAYDNWVCDNDTIFDPDNGAELVPAVSITDDPAASLRTISGNTIPNHLVGDFPNVSNPNAIDEFESSYRVVLRGDAEQPDRSSPNAAQHVGVSLGGVLFDPNTAEVYNNDRGSGWNYEALTIGAAGNSELAGAIGYLGTDCNNAHVQPTGKYHYHGMPEELISTLLEATGANPAEPGMVMIGYAADGFPLYARYGYSDPLDPSSALVAMQGSYELKEGTRLSGPGGSYDGTFVQDWEYVAGSGTLDECNGRFGVTPEFPAGIYHYFVTDDYPFIQRCVWGEPTDDALIGAP